MRNWEKVILLKRKPTNFSVEFYNFMNFDLVYSASSQVIIFLKLCRWEKPLINNHQTNLQDVFFGLTMRLINNIPFRILHNSQEIVK